MPSKSFIWTFDRPIAELRSGELRGRVDVSRPQNGLFDMRLGEAALEGALLAATWATGSGSPGGKTSDWPAQVTDAYVRGGDLVATYGQQPNWPYAPQIYWRAESVSVLGRPITTLSLLVSLQTDSLDSHPAIRVATWLAAAEVAEVGQAADSDAQAFLWRLTGREVSYLEAVPASDFCELSVACDAAGRFTTEWRLFGEFLEKGVIRRVQVVSALLPRERDEELAAESCRILRRRKLPLTT